MLVGSPTEQGHLWGEGLMPGREERCWPPALRQTFEESSLVLTLSLHFEQSCPSPCLQALRRTTISVKLL